jgi:gliding motility-associated-like protein
VFVSVILPNCDETDVYLPNAFTPNGDGVNDIFIVRSNFIKEMSFVIYDRWGNEIFSTTDENVGWDGTVDGSALAPDVFAYSLYVLCSNGETYKTSGNVSLLR